MFNLKGIFFYFLAIKITLTKTIKRFYFRTNYYYKSLKSEIPKQFYFYPNPFLLSSTKLGIDPTLVATIGLP